MILMASALECTWFDARPFLLLLLTTSAGARLHRAHQAPRPSHRTILLRQERRVHVRRRGKAGPLINPGL